MSAIIDWTQTEPVSVAEFRHRQADLMQAGYRVNNHEELGDDFASCAVCDSHQRIGFSMALPNSSTWLWFEVCLSCWTVIELIPVYEGD